MTYVYILKYQNYVKKEISRKKYVFVFSTLKRKYMSCNTLINIRYTKINSATYINKNLNNNQIKINH